MNQNLYLRVRKKSIPTVFAGLFLLLMHATNARAQYNLEFAQGSYSTPPTGPTVTTLTSEVEKNSSGSTYISYSPAITVTAAYTSQVYTSVYNNGTGTGLQFGVSLNSNGTSPLSQSAWVTMDNVSSPTNSMFTGNPYGSSGTGISISDNYAFSLFTATRPLQAAGKATNGRHLMGQLTLTFNRPISNPVLHVVGLGGTVNSLGFSTELDLVSSGATLSKLSGSSELNITSTQILNGSSSPNSTSGSGAATGSIRVTGSNMSSLTFNVYMRGNGGGSTWETSGNYDGDRWLLGLSMSEPTIVGNVYNDANGLTDNAVNGTGTDAGGNLWVNLVDATTGLVQKAVKVASDGTFIFQDIQPASFPHSYNVQLSNIAGVAGATPPATTLPAGYTHTGSFLGSGSGGSNTTPGILQSSLTITNAGTVISNVNFGIEQLPMASGINLSSQGNPGGTNAVSIVNGFSGSDADGTVSSVTLTSFPTNTVSVRVGTTAYYNGSLPGKCPGGYTCQLFPGGGINIASNASGVPASTVTLDPVDGNVTAVVTFNSTDNAGKASTSTSSFNVPFTAVSVTGNVWDDADGNIARNGTERLVSGDNTTSNGSVAAGGNLYVNLINAAGNVIATSQVAADGTYTIVNAPTNTSGLKIQLSTNQGTLDQAMPTTAQPANWVSTGNSIGASNTASQTGAATGTINLTTAGANVSGQCFGMDQRPTADVKSTTITAPTINQLITLNGGTNPAFFTGSDAEDQPASATLNGKRVAITSLPTNGQLWYNGALVNTTGTLPGTFNPDLLQFKATGTHYKTISFQYAYIDAAGVQSTAASYSLSWNVPLPVKLESFGAMAAGCNANVYWKTATEINGDFYAIEESANGVDFNEAGKVSCATIASSYSSVVPRIAATTYFRLKRVATDGSSDFSNIISLNAKPCEAAISVSPNPVRDRLVINGLSSNGDKVVLYNCMGTQVYARIAASTTEIINVENFPAGSYLVQIVYANGLQGDAIRIIKQ